MADMYLINKMTSLTASLGSDLYMSVIEVTSQHLTIILFIQ